MPSDVGAAVMRSINLLKIAAEAEVLRYRCMAARQGRRAAFGAVALVFVLAVLVLGERAAWLALYLRFAASPTILMLLGSNLSIAVTFGLLVASGEEEQRGYEKDARTFHTANDQAEPQPRNAA